MQPSIYEPTYGFAGVYLPVRLPQNWTFAVDNSTTHQGPYHGLTALVSFHSLARNRLLRLLIILKTTNAIA